MEEQYAIVERLEALDGTQRAACEGLGYEIDLLREYRTCLIADVVTGKLDVRKAAARLPEEAEEPLDNAEALAEGDENGESVDLDAVPEETEA